MLIAPPRRAACLTTSIFAIGRRSPPPVDVSARFPPLPRLATFISSATVFLTRLRVGDAWQPRREFDDVDDKSAVRAGHEYR